MKTFLGFIAGAVLLASATAAPAADKAIIVFDASGSMWGQIDGEAKISIARRTLEQVLGTIPDTLELGFMAYGHRDKGSCTDIELIIPPGPNTDGPIVEAANGLTPKGKTPISDAVRKAAEELRYTEEKATVILITDGLETCEADPCAVATELEAAGVDFTTHVVGFGLSAEEGAQVACLAENTGGQYVQAENAAALGQALQTVAEVVVAEEATTTPPPKVTAPPPVEEVKVDYNLRVTSRPAPDADPFTGADGIRYQIYRATADGREEQPIDTVYGQAGSAYELNLPAGRYVIVASKDLAAAYATVELAEGEVTKVDIVLDAGLIIAHAMASTTEPAADDGVRWDITSSAGETDTSYGPNRTILVASGEATVKGTIGTATASVPVDVKAGEIIELDVVLGAGRVLLHGKRAPEATDYDNNIRWDAINAAGEAETAYGGEVKFDLAAGDYTIKATLGEAIAEVKISLAAGQTLDEVVIVATGKIVAHALFAEGGPVITENARFDVLEPEPGLDGTRKTITTAYNDGASFDLPPGKYILVASADDAKAEAGIEVKAGPPLEVNVVLNAGLLAVTAPGGDRLDLLGTKKDIYGKQAIVSTRYGEDWQVTVPAGEYILKVTKSDDTESTTPVTVKAGERTEVTVE